MKNDKLWLDQEHTPGERCKKCGLAYDVWEAVLGCVALDCEDVRFIGSDLQPERE